MKIDLKKYQKQNSEKLDSIGTGISIEKKHKDFLERFNINLSALIRDFIDKLILEKEIEDRDEKE